MSWIQDYKKNIDGLWIRCTLTTGEELYFDKFDGWKTIKAICDKEKLFIDSLSLQFRSHKIDLDVKNCDAVYLIRSVFGQLGGETKNYYTFGRVVGDKVKKQMWLVPELIMDKEFEETINECFAETIIYNETQKN
jgi:hypothetical protein